ncbi:MAG: alpha/beta hydrolase family protein [Promethearchaeia archaeon]
MLNRFRKNLKKNLLIGIFIVYIISVSLLYTSRSFSYNQYERIEFTSGGSSLYANLYLPAEYPLIDEERPLIIFAHGLGSQRDLDIRIPVEFTKRGYFVATIDYQGHGESEGHLLNKVSGSNMPALAQDCSRLLDILESSEGYEYYMNDSQVGLVGHSLGGMVVLMNQALDDRFKATVTWAGLVNPEPDMFSISPDDPFVDYFPSNLLNKNNTENLLVIHHQNDELLSYKNQVPVAEELTGCEALKITEPLIGGAHVLFSDKVLEETIEWFEIHFFGSLRQPITFSYKIDYFLLISTYATMFMFVFALVSSISKLFSVDPTFQEQNLKVDYVELPKKQQKKRIVGILLFFAFFVGFYQIFVYFFDLLGLILAPIFLLIVLGLIKGIAFLRRPKAERERYIQREKVELQFELHFLGYSLCSTLIFLGFYITNAISYPFAFFWPSDFVSFLLAYTVYPLYINMEIFYRKIIFPKLNFIESRKRKIYIMSLMSIIHHGILMLLSQHLFIIASLLVTYLISLIVVILNAIIYTKTEQFSSVALSSFLIIQLFFGAAVSNALRVSSMLHIFVS